MPNPDEQTTKNDVTDNPNQNPDQNPDQNTDDSTSPAAEKETVIVKVDGEDKEVTVEELKKAYSKAEGAEARFEKAAEMRKQAEQGLKIMNLADKIQNDQLPIEERISSFKEYGRLIGTPGSQLDQVAQQMREAYRQQQAQEQNEDEGGSMNDQQNQSTGDQQESQKITKEQLDEGVQRELEESRKARIEQIRQNMVNNINTALDNDDFYGKIKDSNPDTFKKVYGYICKEVRSRCMDGEQFGSEMLEKVLKDAKDLGVGGNPNADAGQDGHPSLGPSATASGSNSQAQEPTKRVAATNNDYDSNFKKRMLEKAAARGIPIS